MALRLPVPLLGLDDDKLTHCHAADYHAGRLKQLQQIGDNAMEELIA